MSFLELRGLGVSETPDIKDLPWEKPSEKELVAERRMMTMERWSLVIGIVAGVAGLYMTVKELRQRR
ncbi:MAG: hypothetical protein ACYTF5_21130 [Planctomycetota bacterium]